MRSKQLAFSVTLLFATSPLRAQSRPPQQEPSTESPLRFSPELDLTVGQPPGALWTSGETVTGDQLVGLLLDLAQRSDPQRQLAAVNQAAIWRHPYLIDALRYILRTSEARLRRAAVNALGAFADPRLWDDLSHAADDADVEVVVPAIKHLATLNVPGAAARLLHIATEESRSLDVRLAAIRALAWLGTESTLAALETLVQTGPTELRKQARASQLAIDADSLALNEKLLLLRQLLSNEAVDERRPAVVALAKQLPADTAAEVLTFMLEDPDASVRLAAVEGLAALEPAIALAKLARLLSDDHSPELQKLALTAVAKISSQAATELLLTRFAAPASLRSEVAAQLATRDDPRAREALSATLDNDEEPETVRLLGLDALIESAPADLRARLERLSTSSSSPALRIAADKQLAKLFPGYVSPQDRLDEIASARRLATGAAAAHGGVALWTMSQIGDGGQPVIAAAAGAVLGGAGAFLLTRKREITRGEAGYFTSAGVWGMGLGVGVLGAAGHYPKPGDIDAKLGWGLLAGQLAGLGIGSLTASAVGFDAGDVLFVDLAALQGFALTLSGMAVLGPEAPSEEAKRRAPYIAMLGGLGIGLLPGLIATKSVELSRDDTYFVASTTLVGGAAGALVAPAAMASDSDTVLLMRRSLGGMGLGQGVGFAFGVLLSQYLELDEGITTWLLAAAASGSAIGTGIGLAASEDGSRTPAIGAEVGLLSSTLIAALVAPRFSLRQPDLDLALAGLAYGSVAGALLPAALSSAPADRQRSGMALALGGLGFASGLVLDHLYEVPTRDVTLTAGGGLAGTFLGVGMSLLASGTDQTTAALGEATALAGVVSGYFAAPYLEFADADLWLIAASTAYGAWLGRFLPYTWTREPDRSRVVWGGALLGSGVGCLGGTLWSQYSGMDRQDVAEVYLSAAAGTALGAGLGLLTPRSVTKKPADRLIMEIGGVLGLTAGAWWAPETRFDPPDRLLISYATAYGALLGGATFGWWTTSLDNPGDHLNEEIIGGVLLGGAVAALSTGWATQHLELSSADVNEIALGALASGLFGMGLGLMIPVEHDGDLRAVTAATQVAGVAGTGAIAYLAPNTDFSTGDRLLGFLTTAYGGWQGIGTALLLDGSDRQVAGAVLATAALGGIGGAAVSQYVDLSTTEVFSLFSGSVWGSWVGGFGVLALEKDYGVTLDDKELLGGFFTGSDLGLLVSALALSPIGNVAPSRVAWINLSGLAGMALGSAAGAIFADSPFWTLNVSGSLAGLVTGTVVTGFVHFDEPSAPEPSSQQATSESRGSVGGDFPHRITSISPQVMVLPSERLDPQGRSTQDVVLGVVGTWM